ncbi:MAG: molybdopterin molybdenumtransferase MoeA [Nitrosopumilales archaeon]|jgi:molybdopterin molybdotransferase|nr:MAG: molybdopterin molybdenumtransferase MoeA [Nitrosopumilales archaeon]
MNHTIGMHWTPSDYTSVRGSYSKLMNAIDIRPMAESIFTEHAIGRVLWTDIISHIDIPSSNCSHMDGFVAKYNDISTISQHGSIKLKVVPRRKDGKRENQILLTGQTIRVSTGEVLPRLGDTVIPVEYTQFDSKNSTIIVQRDFAKGSFVSCKGSEIARKDLLLNKRHVLRAQDLALVSMLGIRKLKIFKKPRVGIIPTGNELTEDITKIKRGKILNTNSRVISNLIETSGGNPLDLGITPDNIHKIKNKIRLALSESDIILTTGGSSVGLRDLVAESINGIGKPGILVHGVKLDRGRVTGLAALRSRPVIILPGPIQGAVNAFIVFAQPLIRFMVGLHPFNKPFLSAKLTEDWNARKKFQNFTKIVYVKLSRSASGEFHAKPITGETTDITVLTGSNGFILVPERLTILKSGQKVKINIFPGLSFSSGNPIEFPYQSEKSFLPF